MQKIAWKASQALPWKQDPEFESELKKNKWVSIDLKWPETYRKHVPKIGPTPYPWT